MTTLEKFNELKEKELSARNTKEQKAVDAEFDTLFKEDPEGFEAAMVENMKETLAEAKRLRMKEQMKTVSEIVSLSYIAKTYFNKTKSWFSQRINGLTVNGKKMRFTDEELETLNRAFKDIADKIAAFHVSY